MLQDKPNEEEDGPASTLSCDDTGILGCYDSMRLLFMFDLQ